MSLADVAGPQRLADAKTRGAYACYFLSDVGGVVDPRPQQAVAAAMCALSPDAQGYDPVTRPCGGTLFAYITGDVVYTRGELSQYEAQFHAPYRAYDRPILAVPGNHDGGPAPSGTTLEGFLPTFCADEVRPWNDTSASPRRHVVSQPNMYWTLEAPWLRIVGLYSNVPEDGAVDAPQARWFREQMARPHPDQHLVVALHHPPLSADRVHGSSRAMMGLVHDEARRAGCRLVISGHAHNYQRFEHDGLTYVVNGGGGYHELHELAPRWNVGTPRPAVAHTQDHSFVHLTVTPDALILRSIAVPVPFGMAGPSPHLIDEVAIPMPVAVG
jgi:predicted phosphodiesterase